MISQELAGALRLVVATVWIAFGLGAKVLRLVPRHERIVARILGERIAPPLTRLIGVAEIGMGAWVLSAIAPPICAVAQTVIIIAMNTLELTRARDLLLAPRLMVIANTVLLAAAWFLALG